MATINEVCDIIAQSGDTTPPAINPVGGNNNSNVFSLNYGFPKLMGTALGAGGEPIPRDEMNGALGYITTFLNSITRGLQVSWLSTVTYSTDCIVFDPTTKNYYRSLQDNNTNHALNDDAWWEVQQSPNPSVNNPTIHQYSVITVESSDNDLKSGMSLGSLNIPAWLNTYSLSNTHSFLYLFAGSQIGSNFQLGTQIFSGTQTISGVDAPIFRILHEGFHGTTTFGMNSTLAPFIEYDINLIKEPRTIATLNNTTSIYTAEVSGGQYLFLLIQPIWNNTLPSPLSEKYSLCTLMGNTSINGDTYNLNTLFNGQVELKKATDSRIVYAIISGTTYYIQVTQGDDPELILDLSSVVWISFLAEATIL